MLDEKMLLSSFFAANIVVKNIIVNIYSYEKLHIVVVRIL